MLLCGVHVRSALLVDVFPLSPEEIEPTRQVSPFEQSERELETALARDVAPWAETYSVWQRALPEGGRRALPITDLQIPQGRYEIHYRDWPADWWPTEQVEKMRKILNDHQRLTDTPRKGPRETAYWLWEFRDDPEKTAAVMILAVLHEHYSREAMALHAGIREHFADRHWGYWHHKSSSLPLRALYRDVMDVIDVERARSWQDLVQMAALSMAIVGFHYSLVRIRGDAAGDTDE